MPATIFNGKQSATEIEKQLSIKLGELSNSFPKLVSIYNPDHLPSALFTRLKLEAAGRVGIPFQPVPVADFRDQSELNNLVRSFAMPEKVAGILIQLPFTGDKRIDRKLTELIPPEKDVDGLTAVNLTKIKVGNPEILPATVRAVLEILARVPGTVVSLPIQPDSSKHSPVELWRSRLPWLAVKTVTVIGARGMVGEPLTDLFRQLAGTTLEAEINTTNLISYAQMSDVLISAIGQTGFVKPEMVKPGAIVIDIGTTVVDGKTMGDVDPRVAETASFLTPVPGGVGPMTVVSLLENYLDLIAEACRYLPTVL